MDRVQKIAEKYFETKIDWPHRRSVELAADIRSAIEEAVMAERLQESKDDAMRALESFTPSGSEFVGDVDACVKFIRETRHSQHSMILKLKLENENLKGHIERLSEDASPYRRSIEKIMSSQDEEFPEQRSGQGRRSALVIDKRRGCERRIENKGRTARRRTNERP